MNHIKKFVCVCFALLASILSVAQDSETITSDTIEQWRPQLSNAGRWGKQDQLGTLNLITPTKRKAAAALVRDGESVSMAHNLLTDSAADNPNPLKHTMEATGSKENNSSFASDRYNIAYHGIAHTHLDALCHAWHEDKMYNGYDRSLVTETGCEVLDINAVRSGIFTRGVLVDIPWVKGVDYLEPGTAVTTKDIEAFEAKAGIKISAGDAVFINTGRWARREAKGASSLANGLPGMHPETALFFKQRDIALLGTDAAGDVIPSVVATDKSTGGMARNENSAGFPVHDLLLTAMGTPIIDNADLGAVSAHARKLGRFEFLLTLAPLRVKGGTGSPVNPVATF